MEDVQKQLKPGLDSDSPIEDHHLESDNETMGDSPVNGFLLDLLSRSPENPLKLSQRGQWAHKMRTIARHFTNEIHL